MTDLRQRLRSSDPLREVRPLDAAELERMRRAIRSAPAGRRPLLGWALAAGTVLAAAGLAAALLLAPGKGAPAPVAPIARVEAVPAPTLEPEVAAVPPPAPSRRPARRAEPAERPPSSLKEVRFVSANGTQILWTFRSPEEGA